MDSLFNKKVKYDAIPFGRFSPIQLSNAFKKDIKIAITQLKQLEKLEESPNFFNTIIELETISQKTYRYYNVYAGMMHINTSHSWCHINDKMTSLLGRYERALASKKIYDKVVFVHENYDANLLTIADEALLHHYYDFFTKQGIGFNLQRKKEFFSIEKKIYAYGIKYYQNLAEINKTTVKVKTKDQLKGVSAHFISIAKKNAQKNSYSGYLLNPTDNIYSEVLNHGKNRNIREKVYNLHYNSTQNKYLESNERIAKEILKLRKRKANMLGFTDFSSLTLSENSVKNYKNLSKMMGTISKTVTPQMKQLYKEITKIAKSQDQISELKSWDEVYYLRKYLQSKYHINEQKLQAYFPLEHVQKELFSIINRMFGVKFTKTRLPVYHKSVEVYKVTKGTKHLGLMYLDIFERATKDSIPFCMPIIECGFNNRPSVVVSCSISSPDKGCPTLLKLDNVIDLFHEMGHALHVLATEIEYSCISGFNVYQDFSEVPSLFFEALVFQPKILRDITCHFKTKKKLSSKTISDLIKMKKIESLKRTFSSIVHSKVDTEVHRASANELRSFSNFEKNILSSITILKPIAGESLLTNFEHIFNSEYQGAYYSYVWSDAVAHDICTQFLKGEKGSFFNKTVANRFYKEILSKGGSLDAEVLYKNFKGSAVSLHPFLRNLKIKS